MVTYAAPAHLNGHVPRPVDDFPPVREPRGYGNSGCLAIDVALGSSVSFPIRRPRDVDWWNTFLCGVGRDLLPPHRYRPRWTVFEDPCLHKLCLPQLRGPTQPPSPSIRCPFRNQGFQTAWASAVLLRPLKRHVAVAPHPTFLWCTSVPRHVFEGVVGGTGLVLPAGPVEDRFVDNRNRIEVIPER